jgi:hypothetical protein
MRYLTSASSRPPPASQGIRGRLAKPQCCRACCRAGRFPNTRLRGGVQLAILSNSSSSPRRRPAGARVTTSRHHSRVRQRADPAVWVRRICPPHNRSLRWRAGHDRHAQRTRMGVDGAPSHGKVDRDGETQRERSRVPRSHAGRPDLPASGMNCFTRTAGVRRSGSLFGVDPGLARFSLLPPRPGAHFPVTAFRIGSMPALDRRPPRWSAPGISTSRLW